MTSRVVQMLRGPQAWLGRAVAVSAPPGSSRPTQEATLALFWLELLASHVSA